MYVQYKNPDKEALKELVYKIKGDRPMRKFADDIKISYPNIKVSPATLSRALNVEDDSAVSIELLKAIALIADKETEVTIDMLAEANGLRTQAENDQLTQKSDAERRRDYLLEMDRTATMIIQSEIVSRGFPVRALSGLYNGASLHGYLYQNDRMFPRNYNFGFAVSGLVPSTWKFSLNSLYLPEGGSQNAVDAHVGHFINRIASVLASDNMESDLYESEKYSFFFIDRKLYEAFLKKMNDHEYRTNGLMTAILIDIEAKRVIEETQLKRYDEEEQGSFFNNPVLESGDELDLSDPYTIIEEDI